MPELPEVETIRRQLTRKIIGKKLNDRKVINVRRRAKILIIDFSDNSSLVFHLKLTGQLIFNGKPLPSTRKVFYFKDGSRLVFNDKRKFGWWKTVKNSRTIEKQFGPEALEINLSAFKDILSRRPNSKIKSLLMDQKFIAGIGNIYSDEILYAAKIHPLRRVKTLSNKEIEQIFHNIGKILNAAIKFHGSSVTEFRTSGARGKKRTSFSSPEYYIDACGKKGNFVKYHQVYQKEGQKCRRCAMVIERIKISGRSARFCPNCQPLLIV